jgi:hypothetical protein
MRRQPGDRDEMAQGYVEYGINEVAIVCTVEDPPAVRLASRVGGLGKVSFSRLRADGGFEEVGLLQGKLDERNPASLAGEVTLHLRRPNSDGDGAMVAVATLRHDGITFHVPTNIAAPSNGVPSFLQSHNGLYQLHLQGDRNLVLYGPNWAPVWSTGTHL